MKQIKTIYRLFYINWVLAKHGLDEFILALPLFAPLRFLAHLNPWNWFRGEHHTRGERIRLAFEELGPIFVKFGQMLSTRRDFLPEDIADELAKLQDQVPPFAGIQARAVLKEVYGLAPEEIFMEFSEQPLASASVAQVHPAKLKTGQSVVVKILRPNITKLIARDIALLELIAKLTERYWSEGPRLRPREVVAEFARTLHDELDLQREAANASQLRRNFIGSDIIYVPEIFWRYTHKKVMVMERIYGIPISDLKTLQEKSVNLKKLAEHGVEIFFTQVFRDCFFHADMHPGNVFVNIQDPENPIYTAIDFGIMGTLNPTDQRYLAENLLAFFKRDYRRVAELHVASGWVNPTTRIDVFESAIRTVCEPIFEQPLKDISCGQLLVRLFETAAQFEMEVQPQLLLLQKTLLNIEGLGRQLYPDLDLWHTAKPFLEHWLKKQIGPRALIKKVFKRAPYWLEKLPELPELLYDNLNYQKQHNQLQQFTRASPGQSNLPQMHRRRHFLAGIGATLVSASTLVFIGTHTTFLTHLPSFTSPQWLLGAFVVGLILFVIGRTKTLTE
jgi:ubiquinone biosynthesis protein